MSKLSIVPDAIRLLSTILKVDHYEKDIKEAAASGDGVEERRRIGAATDEWSRRVSEKFGFQVEVIGAENVPKEDGLLFISNHQGYADIIALFLALPGRQLGFVAKDTLEKVPLLGKWIHNIRGFYIKRGDAKEALKSLREGSRLIEEGYNMVIFPEGTRSRGGKMGKFKSGSFKLATRAKATIVPVTIDGTWRLFEEQGKAVPGKVKVTLHPPIATADLSRSELSEMEKHVEDTIRGTLEEEAR